MGCCSSFTAATAAAAADPNRHVNFTTGMVLGVDDYGQEFVYHSARDKWIVRDFLGYGTLSGLAVAVDNDGAKGPRVRVSAGAGAAPSGQLICVGRDQCGSINGWLAGDEVVEKLTAITGGTATAATLNLFLTLCYVDCPVADVPIPGEPCRSDENLMAPSRIADDYCLEFRFEAPPMREAQALDVLTAFWTTLDIAAGNPDTDNAFQTALRKSELQLRLALGITDPAAPAPTAADLDPVKLHPNATVPFAAAVKRIWITRLRPMVAAQSCNAQPAQADDCLLLARLTVPIVQVGSHWEVAAAPAGQETAVTVDERERPLLLAASLTQTLVGPAMAVDERHQSVAFFTANGNIANSVTFAVVRSDTAIAVKIFGATGPSVGKLLTIKAAGDGEVTVTTPSGTKIDGKDDYKLPVRGSVSLVSDGAGTWHVTAKA